MRKSVSAKIMEFNADPHLEGKCNFMYLDRLGLVTTGIGNLIDPFPLAQWLPWRKKDGSLAMVNEVRSCWEYVKRKAPLDPKGGGVQYGNLPSNGLRLTDNDISVLVRKKALEFESQLKKYVKNWDKLPADAQLGLLSVAWAAGAGDFDKYWPKLCGAVNRMDFLAAASESSIKDNKNRTIVNGVLFHNAAKVVSEGLDPEVLLYVAPWKSA